MCIPALPAALFGSWGCQPSLVKVTGAPRVGESELAHLLAQTAVTAVVFSVASEFGMPRKDHNGDSVGPVLVS